MAEENNPIDMVWLRECTDGDSAMIKSMLDLYLSRTTSLIAELDAAIAANSAPEVRRIAHACCGSSGTCGISKLAELFKNLEKLATSGNLDGAPAFAVQIKSEFERVKVAAAKIQN